MTSAGEKIYYPGLDALRGIAILSVLLYHYFSFFRVGWMGVDLFFVLSGFLITNILIRAKKSNHYFRNFFARRILRIFPLYFSVLIIFFLAAPLFFTQKDPNSTYNYYIENQFWFWAFFENWLFIFKGRPPEPYLIHFWSLAVEEQFYLVWPLLIYSIKELTTLRKILLAILFVALLLRCIFWYIPTTMHQFNYYGTLTRIDTLSAGALLAVLINKGKTISKIWISIFFAAFGILCVASWMFYKNFDHYNGAFATWGYTAIALFFMGLCYIAVNEKLWIAQWTFLKFAGRISFGLYVFHLPVFMVLSSVLNPYFQVHFSNDLAQVLVAFVSLAVTFMVSYFSYKWFELPILKMKSKFY